MLAPKITEHQGTSAKLETSVKRQSRSVGILLAMAIVAFGLSALQGQAPARKTAKPATKATSNDEQVLHDIRELERSLREAFIDGKSAWWERHLDDHYAGLNPDGQTVNKSKAMQFYGSPDVKYEEMNLGDMGARIYGDCIIASTRSTVQGNYKGQDFSGDYYFVHVWVKEGTEWKLANSQATKLQSKE